MKKKNIIALIVLIIVIIMVVLPFLSYFVYAADNWEEVETSSMGIGENLSVTSSVYLNKSAGDRFTEDYCVYKPGGDILPLVAYGHDILGAASLSKAAQYVEEENDCRVIGALNGDFFTVATGVSIGMVVREGTLRTSGPEDRYHLIFQKNGKATIAQSGLNIQISGSNMDGKLENVHLNKTLSKTSGVVLFDSNFGETNSNTQKKHSYYMQITSGKMKLGSTIRAKVTAITNDARANALRSADDLLVLCIEDDTDFPKQLEAMKDVKVGDTLTIKINADEAVIGAENIVGGGDLLIENGQIVAPNDGTRAPRTAVGIRKDGTIVLYEVDGRQPGYSIGMTMKELAERMQELGCEKAINLDGGGSTTMEIAYPGDYAMTLVNQPSGSSLRACANYIFLVTKAKASGTLAHLHLYPYSATVLTGASLNYTVKATDGAYYPVAAPATVSYTASAGKMTGNTFTASEKAGEVKITARKSTIAGTAYVNVVDRVDQVVLRSEESGLEAEQVTLTKGDTYDFTADAILNRVTVVSQDTCYAWSCSENIGTIDEKGVFTAGDTFGNGKVTVTAGGKSASCEIHIVPKGNLLDGFESANIYYLSRVGNGTRASLMTTNQEKVRFGQQSLELSYDFSQSESKNEASYQLSGPVSPSATEVNFWVYGDGSGNFLGMEFDLPEEPEKEPVPEAPEVPAATDFASGTDLASETDLATATDLEPEKPKRNIIGLDVLNFKGWKQYTVAIPENAIGIRNFVFAPGEKNVSSGKIYLDQFVESNGPYSDHEAPEVALNLEKRTLSGVITDNMDGSIMAGMVTVTYDGQKQVISYNDATQSFSVQLPDEDGYDHQVSVTAADLSGNRSRTFMTLAAEKKEADAGDVESDNIFAKEIPFTDTEGHWAESYANYLYQQKLSMGIETPNGLEYQPEEAMTRQEIAVMMARWLGVMGKYDSVELPYQDAASIPDWALPAAKAMYALGIINGTSLEDGSLWFSGEAVLNRETIMTMIGRIQDRGFAESNLAFEDADQIDSWAIAYVKSLVGQGVIKGDGKTLRPLDPVTRGEAAKIIFCLY